MAGSTDHYGLSQLGQGDNFSTNGYKYTDADRKTIDSLLYLGAEGHHHTGLGSSLLEPTLAPSLSLFNTGGTIPAGTRVYYKYTYVNERGEETIASPEAFVDTTAAITSPSAPVLTPSSTGGLLLGGNYYYILTSYVNVTTAETKALNPQFITISATTATNKITITLPEAEAGQTGFNLYRRAPGQTKYFHLAVIPTNVATPPTTYVDDGTVAEDCDRGVPLSNTTNNTNSVTISMPGATPAVPAGYTWKLYRTYVNGGWNSSLLHHIVENISEGSPIITPAYLDVGNSTRSGTFPSTSLTFGNPTKIHLQDEVQSTLPMGLTAFPWQVTFNYSGPLNLAQGAAVWPCEFLQAEIVSCRAVLGRGSAPVATSVVVDINKAAAGATPSFSTIYTNQDNRPRVSAGLQVGNRTTPNITSLVRGDLLSMDIDAIGGGATPTDRDLVVTVYMIVYGYPETSYPEGLSGGVGGVF